MNTPFDSVTDFIFVETEISPADVIVIPGSDHPPLMEKAVSLFQAGFAPYILPSGGSQPHMNRTEWEYLRDIALKSGVPPEAILKEDQARHTLENAQFSIDVLKKQHIERHKVIIVCKACHSRRALLTYQSVFPLETEFYVAPVVDRYDITKENWFQSEIGIKRTMAEVERIGKYFSVLFPIEARN